MTWADVVAEHDGHWLRFDGIDAVRCHPCDGRRLLLPLRDDLTPTPAPPPLHAADRCPRHPGQRQGSCGGCRSDSLADDTACEWCGRAIYRAGFVWLAIKGQDRDYDPLVCDASDDDRHNPPATQPPPPTADYAVGAAAARAALRARQTHRQEQT